MIGWQQTMIDRFIRYVKIATYSLEGVGNRPSSPQQIELARILVDELNQVEACNVRMSDDGYLYAELPPSTCQHHPPQTEPIQHIQQQITS